ncbi:ThiF family adenylyltransferase [Pseudomonas sp. HS6]|uniref:HesA/MoeB/ThiF family protein n=1 Tax=Pseudomonas sp. HS6 TaxID=2850559 RepID=UPI00201840AE|nr:ThiF family adenylyltransferase [Pseudomonas sp. HS6]UQS13564.1 ThiF family adenylyltransferase [Pseudomonas sp. HS6]
MDNATIDFYLKDEQGAVLGLIAPSTFFAETDSGLLIDGPKNTVRINQRSIAGLAKGLAEAGSLATGTLEELAQVHALLENPATSRTTSYFLCGTSSCSAIIEDTNTIEKSTALVVGCGGIGSVTAMVLAGCGIKKFILVDADAIEESNLNRQLFWTRADIGQPKVSTLKNAIEARFLNTTIETLAIEADKFAIENLQRQYDANIIIITADNPSSLAEEAAGIAQATGVPVVSGGYNHSNCKVYLHSGEYVETLSATTEITPWQRLPHSIMPSFGPLNVNMASLLASGSIAMLAKRSFESNKDHTIEWDACHFPLNFQTEIY